MSFDERWISPAAKRLDVWTPGLQVMTCDQTPPECLLSIVPCCQPGTRGPLACPTSSNDVKIFDDESLVVSSCLRGHSDLVHSLTFHPGSRLLLSSSEDSTCKFWDIRSPQKPVIDIKTGEPIFSSDSNGCIVAAGTESGDIFLWDLRALSSRLGTLDELHTEEITCLRFHPTRQSVLFSAALDCLISTVELNASTIDDALESVISTEQPIRDLGFFGPNLEYAFGVSEVESLELFSLTSSAQVGTFPDVCNALSTTLSTRYIAGCHYESSSQRLCLFSGNYHGDLLGSFVSPVGVEPVLTMLGGHQSGVRSCYCRGDVIFSAGEDARLVCWKKTFTPT